MFKGKTIECFNYSELQHMAFECSSPKDVKKTMQVTWSDIESSGGETSNPGEIKYKQNDHLAFMILILMMMFVHFMILL